MGNASKDYKFAIGERVGEKPRVRLFAATSTQGIKTAQQYFGIAPRVGEVVGQTIRKTKRANRKFIEVLWDGHERSTFIDQMRLCREDDLQQLTDSTVENHA